MGLLTLPVLISGGLDRETLLYVLCGSNYT